jgi:hypothetical protein
MPAVIEARRKHLGDVSLEAIHEHSRCKFSILQYFAFPPSFRCFMLEERTMRNPTDDEEVIFVKSFRARNGKLMVAAAYGKKAWRLVVKKKRK